MIWRAAASGHGSCEILIVLPVSQRYVSIGHEAEWQAKCPFAKSLLRQVPSTYIINQQAVKLFLYRQVDQWDFKLNAFIPR